MIRLHPTTHKIETSFIVALFTMFAATAFLVVLIGAKQYQQTADCMNRNYEVRTATSYLVEKVRQSDVAGSISITELDGLPSLLLTSVEGDRTYFTYIYCYDGMLRELYVSEEAVYSAESGQEIIPLHGFCPSQINPRLIRVSVTGTDDVAYPVYLDLRSAGRKETV